MQHLPTATLERWLALDLPQEVKAEIETILAERE